MWPKRGEEGSWVAVASAELWSFVRVSVCVLVLVGRRGRFEGEERLERVHGCASNMVQPHFVHVELALNGKWKQPRKIGLKGEGGQLLFVLVFGAYSLFVRIGMEWDLPRQGQR